MTYTIQIRPRRQITLPKNVIDQLGVSIGDQLTLTSENKSISLVPAEATSLDALKTIQRLFKTSKISEKTLQTAVENDRLINT